ncbi:MAG: hypothetical protein OEY59_02530, partial [Deltaproteobacteria bacterium]|nr:hypothetical protein [Deltaproteobacteria bacterium]
LINFNVLVNGCKGSCTSWWEVQTVRYTPAGWGAATQQTTSGNHAYTYPGVKIDSTGKGLAVHRDDNANYSSMTFNGSWGSRLDNITGTTTASGGVLKMSPSGVGVLSYRTPSTGQSNLYTLTYNAGAWDTPVQMNTDITTPISCNQIEIDPAGNVISVWIQNNGTRDQLFAVRYDASAGTWGTVTPIDDLSAGAASTCGIKTDKSGNMTAYWLQNDGSVNNVYLSRYDISSSSWSLPQIIDNLTTNAMKPRLALNDEGEGLIVWAQDDGTGVFNLHGSFAR